MSGKIKITVNRYPAELDKFAKKKSTYPTVRYGQLTKYEITIDDIESLWSMSNWACQCGYYLIYVGGKVYKCCSGCAWDKSWIAGFDSVEEYIELCKKYKVSERWLTRTPALK